jgi:poly(3-hydroxybutyrate) depolymerase
MRKSPTVLALAAGAILTWVHAGYAQTPQPDTKSANYQAKGEQDKSYIFPGTTESIPYHIYVPTKWDKNTRLPLVILTHGANQPATAPFQRPMNNPTLAKMAEERGFIVAAVTGYHANATGVGGWNVPYPMVQVQRAPRAGGSAAGAAPAGGAPAAGAGSAAAAPGAAAQAGGPAAGAPAAGAPLAGAPAGGGGGGRAGRGPAAPPATAEDFARAEQDIVNVRNLMMAEYNADPNRVYLMGNSSGGSAVWNLGAKNPELWTAISPSAAPLEDASFPYEKLKTVPVLVVHGDMDTTMVFDGSKAMVDHAKAKGLNVTWLPVVGGQHVDAWAQPEILKQTFDFFDKYKTKQK